MFRECQPFRPLGGAAVTVGRFDGVHRGHRALLIAARRAAASIDGGRAVAVTFWPPPEWVLRPHEPKRLLTTLDDRIELLAASGVDDVVVMRFDLELSQHSAERFLRGLGERLDMRALVTGPNAAIGRNREGTPEVIRRLAPRLGFRHIPVQYEGRPGEIASRKARRALQDGDAARLRTILGRAHSLAGEVATGDGRGRALGFPTANVQLPAWLARPADGVYVGFAATDGDPAPRPALVSAGSRPTFGAGERLFEVHLLDAERDLYGQRLRTFLWAWLRGQEAFASVDDLVRAMQRDRQAAAALAAPASGAFAPFAAAVR